MYMVNYYFNDMKYFIVLCFCFQDKVPLKRARIRNMRGPRSQPREGYSWESEAGGGRLLFQGKVPLSP